MSITAQLIEDYKEVNRDLINLRMVPGTPNCLLVEDDDNDAQLSKYALNSLGVEVNLARTGDEAIALLDRSKDPARPDYAIMFLDLVLRGSAAQGIEVLEHVRKFFPTVHVVLVSGHIDEGILNFIARYRGQGAYIGLVSKPLRREEVKDIFNKHRIPTKDYEI